MPYTHEHAARLKEPEKYDSFARVNDELGKGIHVIYGIKDGKSEMQAIHFDADIFSTEHNIEPIEIEAAITKGHKLYMHNVDLGGAAPDEIQILPYGEFDTPRYGHIVIDDESVASIMETYKKRKNDPVIDYEHQSFADPPVIAPAAGWIKQLIPRGRDGIWAKVEWTDRARRMIAQKEYRYFSPVTLTRPDGKIMAVLGGGLTNIPNIDGMQPLINKTSFPRERKHKEADMERIALLLGLPESATEDEVIAAIKQMMDEMKRLQNQAQTNKAVTDILGLKESATTSEITGTIMAMKQAHSQQADLAREISELKARLAQRDAEEAVERALHDGKITPAQRDWALEYAKKDLAAFQVYLNKAPVIVRTDRITKDGPSGDPALDEMQQQVNRMMGISDDLFRKHNRAA